MLSLLSRRLRLIATIAALVVPGLPAAPAGAEAPALLSPAAAGDSADFDVYLPLRDADRLRQLIYAQVREGSPQYHKWLTPETFIERFGPSPQTIAAATAALRADGFVVTARTGQKLRVEASAAQVEAAFGVRLSHARFADGTGALVAAPALRLPPALAELGAVVPQFAAGPPKHKQSRLLRRPVPVNKISPTGPYFTADLREAYDYPSATAADGSGATIGILMTADYDPGDIARYFAKEGAASFAPHIAEVPIDGGAPFDPGNSDETTLDIEQSAGMALNANVVLYNLVDLSDPSILAGLDQLVSDNRVDVVNMSFAGPEIASSRRIVVLYDNLFMQGSAQGISFVASSGDNGACGDPCDPQAITPSSPASDPFVTAVGGTNLVTRQRRGSNDTGYVSENAEPDLLSDGALWASGGGVSIFWRRPDYQRQVKTGFNARTLPDLALHMGGCLPGDPGFVQPCPARRSSDFVVLGGRLTEDIGTSAAAPDIVGLLAINVSLSGRLGLVNEFLYARAADPSQAICASTASPGCFFHHHGIVGNNGVFRVRAPYDLVIGLGTVDARQLFGLTGLPAAGPPATAGNP